MIRDARAFNKDRQLPSPQDVKLRIKKGQSIRLSFTRFPDLLCSNKRIPDFEKDPIFTGCHRHYLPPEFAPENSSGGYVLCKGLGCSWCKHIDENVSFARMAISTPVVVWATDWNGVLQSSLVKDGMFDVMPWVFSRKVFAELNILREEFPLGNHDIVISCDRERYQRILIKPAKFSLFKQVVSSCAEGNGSPDLNGFCHQILQETEAFTKLLPKVLGLEALV